MTSWVFVRKAGLRLAVALAILAAPRVVLAHGDSHGNHGRGPHDGGGVYISEESLNALLETATGLMNSGGCSGTSSFTFGNLLSEAGQ